MEVECLNDMLVCLVMWLFGKLCCMFTKLLVIVSVYRRATLRKAIRPVRSTLVLANVGENNSDIVGVIISSCQYWQE